MPSEGTVVCLFVRVKLACRKFITSTNDTAYLTHNKGVKFCGIFSEIAPLKEPESFQHCHFPLTNKWMLILQCMHQGFCTSDIRTLSSFKFHWTSCACVYCTGLLKPSAILGRETVTEKHNSTITVKSSLSSQQSATTHSDTTSELPSFANRPHPSTTFPYSPR